jgi:hypothetical protein
MVNDGESPRERGDLKVTSLRAAKGSRTTKRDKQLMPNLTIFTQRPRH